MAITFKDQLDQLRAERTTPNATIEYDIDGPIQTAVKSNVHSERIGKINRGDRTLKAASDNFREQLSFKSLNGAARAQFEPKPSVPKYHQSTQAPSPETVPPQDRGIAEETWRENAIYAIEETFSKTIQKFRQDMKQAATRELER